LYLNFRTFGESEEDGLTEESSMRKRPFAAALASLFWLMWLSPLPADAAVADPYHLGVADKVRIKVYEWRDAVGEVHEWSSVNGDFSVGPGGTLPIPLIGDVPAAGHTVEEVASTISDRLQATVKMAKGPDVSVEILQYRPFYILGSVSHPGEFPYHPGMTVLQALSIAGGAYRLEDPTLFRSSLMTQGDFRVLSVEYYTQLARRARLQAELNSSGKIDFPAELLKPNDDAEITQICNQEQATFAADRQAFQSQSDALLRQKDLLNKEITSLNAKIATADQESTMLKSELDRVTTLVGKGLAVAPQEFSLRQNYLEAQSRRLDLDTAALRAREEIGKSDQSLLELSNQLRKETMSELALSESKLAEISTRMGVAKAIIQQDTTAGPVATASGPAEAVPLTYSIVRRNAAGEGHEINATETTLVEPEDTIKVSRTDRTHPSPSPGATLNPGAAARY
jgi:polysaccharide biosynthesis/export protein ExoF